MAHVYIPTSYQELRLKSTFCRVWPFQTNSDTFNGKNISSASYLFPCVALQVHTVRTLIYAVCRGALVYEEKNINLSCSTCRQLPPPPCRPPPLCPPTNFWKTCRRDRRVINKCPLHTYFFKSKLQNTGSSHRSREGLH